MGKPMINSYEERLVQSGVLRGVADVANLREIPLREIEAHRRGVHPAQREGEKRDAQEARHIPHGETGADVDAKEGGEEEVEDGVFRQRETRIQFDGRER